MPTCRHKLQLKIGAVSCEFFSVFFLFAISSATAMAEQYNRFDMSTILKSVQCEMGQFAHYMRNQNPAAERMFASYTVSLIEQNGRKIGGGFKILGFGGGASYALDDEKERRSSGKARNLHADNRKACARRSHINIGIFECLREQSSEFLNGNDVFCRRKMMATAEANVKGGFNVYIVELEPPLVFIKKRTFEVVLTAPPPKEK